MLKKARKVSVRLGASLEETVRMFMSQAARTGRVPLSLRAEDELLDRKRRNDLWSALEDSKAEDW